MTVRRALRLWRLDFGKKSNLEIRTWLFDEGSLGLCHVWCDLATVKELHKPKIVPESFS